MLSLSSTNKVSAIILAAGKGTRMKSSIAKVLHTIQDKPMIEWVIDALKQAGINDICAVINKDMDIQTIKDIYPKVRICIQNNQLGTADAVSSSYPFFEGVKIPSYASTTIPIKKDCDIKLENSGYVLICLGDTPAVRSETLSNFIESFLSSSKKIGVLGMKLDNPYGYGRLVLNDKDELLKIVEEKDCNENLRKINLCNSGIIISEVSFLFDCLSKLEPNNAQKEYYLTDCFEIARKKGYPVFVAQSSNYKEFMGVNDIEQLEAMRRYFDEER